MTMPGDWTRAGLGLGMLALEAQMVMAMRTAGMMGAWSVLPTENRRMMDEKAPAFAEAAQAAGAAAMAGKRPDQVLDAWTRPLRRTARANARRLGRRGPRIG
ncbi:hypothetical protein BCF33_0934 [Hasllibacter halocynthiae]|uniref:Antifreeze protein n=1 Tax=Hasllibacter halocynthiae TaxID=595589 RepID=A0A2T0X8P5_9RHOB|nr:antifreeze protein [Hasllibacter halocynthiae]PRY95316.1 hypothetical protein BCF33_0934 [Hasllibacter halocynthiae]